MDKLLHLISSMQCQDVPPSELFRLFAARIRDTNGSCATALVCTEGLHAQACRVLSYYDHHGRPITESLVPDPCASNLPVYAGEKREEILDPAKPVIHRGMHRGIHPIFGSLFDEYIDAIALPLYQQGSVYRWLLILFPERGMVDRVDIERSLLIATLAINYFFSVQDARRLEEANTWIRSELEAVGRIQKLLLPQDLSDTPGIRVAKYFKPHAYVGGDYYDLVHLSDQLDPGYREGDPRVWGFMIADASGHGAAAAVEIAMMDAIIRTYKPGFEEGTAGVLNYSNRYFFTRMLRGSYISAFVGSYHPQQHLINYANAGHPEPVIKRVADNSIQMVNSARGIPLGIDREFQWESASIEMYPGDMMVLYTDGVTEAKSPDDEVFGMEKLKAVIRDAPQDPDMCLKMIQDALVLHQGEAEQNDDQTALVVQVI